MAAAKNRDRAERLDVRFFALPDDLAGCFSTIYRCRIHVPANRLLVDNLLPEWSNLRFFKGNNHKFRSNKDGTMVESRFVATGPSSRPIRFEIGSTSMWGVGLFPLGWARFVGVQAETYADTVVDGDADGAFAQFLPLADALDSATAGDEQQFALIMDFFRNLASPPRDTQRITRVHEAMLDPYLVDVTKLAESVGLTKRTLERTCARHFGFPPRLLLRRQRIIRSLVAFMLAEDKNWSETIDRHYHDQAHFVHEFHSFMGMSPTEYVEQDHPIIRAFIGNRQQVWGMPIRTTEGAIHSGDGETGV